MLSLSLGLSLGATRTAGGGNAFDPADLGSAVAVYDPSNAASVFQDEAGTTPTTADGDPIGLMLDETGNGNSITAATLAERPTLGIDGGTRWMEGDGVNSHPVSEVVTFPADFTVSIAAKVTDTSTGNQFQSLLALRDGGQTLGIKAGETGKFFASLDIVNLGATSVNLAVDYLNVPMVLTLIVSQTNSTIELRVNGTSVATAAGYNGGLTGNVDIHWFSIVNGLQKVGGNIYGAVIDGSVDNVAAIEGYLSGKLGD